MKCVFLVSQLEFAGAQNALCELAKGFANAGHDVTLVGLYEKNCSAAVFSERAGVPVLSMNMKQARAGRFRNALLALAGFARLVRMLRKERPDVLLCFTRFANWSGAMAGAIASVRVRVISQRNSWRGASKIFFTIDRWIANSALVTKVTAVSEETKRFSVDQEGFRSDKILTIPNGVDLARFSMPNDPDAIHALRADLKLEPADFVVVTVARFYAQKGHRHLIQAVALAEGELPENTRFLLVGDGPLLDEIRSDIKNAGLERRFVFAGVRDDVPNILCACDMFVLPSLHEGMPNVVLEAMAAGLPVAATAVDGALEIIQDGVNGCLFAPADPEGLAKVLVDFARSKDLRDRYGKSGLATMKERYDQQVVVERYQRLFKELLNEDSRR